MTPVKEMSALKPILAAVQVCCKYRNFGCQVVESFLTIDKHEKNCGSCEYCSIGVFKKGDEQQLVDNMKSFVILGKRLHHLANICKGYDLTCPYKTCNLTMKRDQLEEHFCFEQIKQNLEQSDLENYDAVKAFFKTSLTCNKCKCLARTPVCCVNCDALYCKFCTQEREERNPNTGVVSQVKCNQCKDKLAVKEEVNRIIKNLLVKVKVRCPKACGQVIDYELIDEHERSCGACMLCH